MNFNSKDTKAIKGVAILLMLYHHLFAFPYRIPEGAALVSLFSLMGQPAAYWIGKFGDLCVPLFAFMGGYGTFLSCSRSGDVTAAIWKKIRGLYSSYWKVFFLAVPLCMLLGVEQVTVDLTDFLWNVSGMKITYCQEWWFFTVYITLMFLYPVFHGFFSRPRNPFTGCLLILLVELAAVHVLPRLPEYTWAAGLTDSRFWTNILLSAELIPCFLLGVWFAKHDLLSRVKECCSRKVLPFFGAGILLFCVFYFRLTSPEKLDHILVPVFVLGLTALLSSMPGKYLRPVLSRIGEESTNIWLIHSVYCYLLLQKVVYAPRFTPAIFLLLLVMSFATSVVLRKGYDLLGIAALKVKKVGTKS